MAAAICCLFPSISTAVFAQESGTQLRNIIDAEILTGQESTVGSPTEASDDYTFARRISIDLTGRPLTVPALQAFIANPDLPIRWASGAKLARLDPGTLYTPGADGYTSYPKF